MGVQKLGVQFRGCPGESGHPGMYTRQSALGLLRAEEGDAARREPGGLAASEPRIGLRRMAGMTDGERDVADPPVCIAQGPFGLCYLVIAGA